MTIVVLALDALDYELVDYFGFDRFKLDGGFVKMETVAHQFDFPFTPEAWATMATGLEPTAHGVTESGASQWDNPFVDFASKFVGHLDVHTRAALGRIVKRTTGAEYTVGETDSPTVFDHDYAVVHNWPGVTNGAELREVWRITDGEPPQEVFERELLGKGTQQFAWAEEMLDHPVGLAGVHIHTLDMATHAYGDDEHNLRRMYEWTARMVAEVAAALGPDDHLLVLSDHGSYTGFYDPDIVPEEQPPGKHAFRAVATTTHPDGPPESVYEVKEWLEARVDTDPGEETEMDLPMEHLRELGYVE